MRPDFWLGVGLRRLGTIAGIVAVRDETEARLARHGGDFAELNERLMARTEAVLATVAQRESSV